MTTLLGDPMYVVSRVTGTTFESVASSFHKAWFDVLGEYPSKETLALLLAQSALETGRWKQIMNFNFGNLKRKPGQKFTMFATGENLWDPKTKKTKWVWFEVPDPQTAFRAYDSMIDGAKDYILFLSDRQSKEQWRNEAYKVAFNYMKAGDPANFSLALFKAGYYTANPEKYTAGIVRIYNEFLSKVNSFLEFKSETEFNPPENIIQEQIQIDKSIISTMKLDALNLSEKNVSPISKSQNGVLIISIVAIISSIYAWFTGMF